MIEETGQVVEVEGEFAWVETQRQSTCGSCAANKGCGTAVLSKVLGQKRNRVRALNRAGAHSGDTVTVGIQEDALVRGSLAMYAVPLLALLGGGLVGQYLQQSYGSGEGLVILAGLIGLFGGLLWLRGFSRRAQSNPRYQPVVLRKVSPLYSSENRVLTL
jgi:sigma-E factor negative regulatory protein RseC